MAVTRECLLVAGPPDVIDAKDPLGAFEGRKGGVLQAMTKADGKRFAEIPLKSPPVFDGLIAAGARVFIAGVDGSVTCLAGRKGDKK